MDWLRDSWELWSLTLHQWRAISNLCKGIFLWNSTASIIWVDHSLIVLCFQTCNWWFDGWPEQWTQLTFSLSCLILCTSPTLDNMPQAGYNQKQGWQITRLEERGGGKKAGVLLTLAVDEGLCKTRAHSPRSSSRQFSLHSTRLSNTSCHKSLPALLSQPVTKLRLSHVSRWFEVTLWDIVLGLCAPHRWGESRQLCGQQGRPAAWEPRHRDGGHRCRPETEAISQPAPVFFSSQQTPVFWMS